MWEGLYAPTVWRTASASADAPEFSTLIRPLAWLEVFIAHRQSGHCHQPHLSMPSLRRAAAAVAAFLAVLPLAPLTAQIQPLAPLDGEYLPIAGYNRTDLDVLKDGKVHRTSDMNYVVRPHSAFGEGFVEIRDVRPDLDPLRQATAKERTDPSAVRFRYRAVVVADRPLAHCYALLTFV